MMGVVWGPTWLPPSPWQGYMMRGFPPWLFSPTSRQLLVPSFFICAVGEREVLGKRPGRKTRERKERGGEGKREGKGERG